MDKNRKLIITLIIIITVIVIAVTGVIIFFALQEEDNGASKPNKIERTEKNDNEDQEEEEDKENEEVEDSTETRIDEIKIEEFNPLFTSFEGRPQHAILIKKLLDRIEQSNSYNLKHQITLDNTGITSEEQVDDEKSYNVELAYDDEGYVNLIKIVEANGEETESTTQGNNEQENEEQQNTTSDMDKLLFNSKLTSYLGNITGEQVNSLLQACQENVNTNPDHTININGRGFTEIVATDIYTVTFEYDDNGYINTVIIDKKV